MYSCCCYEIKFIDCTVQCSAVQCSAVQCSAVQCSAVQCSAVQYSTTIDQGVICSYVPGVAQGVITGIRGLCNGLGPALYGIVFYLFHVDLNQSDDDMNSIPKTHLNPHRVVNVTSRPEPSPLTGLVGTVSVGSHLLDHHHNLDHLNVFHLF